MTNGSGAHKTPAAKVATKAKATKKPLKSPGTAKSLLTNGVRRKRPPIN